MQLAFQARYHLCCLPLDPFQLLSLSVLWLVQFRLGSLGVAIVQIINNVFPHYYHYISSRPLFTVVMKQTNSCLVHKRQQGPILISSASVPSQHWENVNVPKTGTYLANCVKHAVVNVYVPPDFARAI